MSRRSHGRSRSPNALFVEAAFNSTTVSLLAFASAVAASVGLRRALLTPCPDRADELAALYVGGVALILAVGLVFTLLRLGACLRSRGWGVGHTVFAVLDVVHLGAVGVVGLIGAGFLSLLGAEREATFMALHLVFVAFGMLLSLVWSARSWRELARGAAA